MQKLGLLIVEPHQVVRDKIASLFINTKFDAYTTSSWEGAKLIIESKKIDVVITEILIGNGTVFQLAPYLKERNPFAEVFVWTKEVDKLVLFEVYKAGVDSINSKSWSIQLIRQKILGYAKKRHRIDTYIRENFLRKGHILKVGDLELHMLKTTAIFKDKKVKLTPHEMVVLSSLMTKPDEIVSIEDIMSKFDKKITLSQLRVYIFTLKKKLQYDIHSHKGLGYSISN